MKKIKIFVACHKPCEVYRDEVYIPIHVGRAISKCTTEMSDYIGDDTGDNISSKNASFCELTAQYWAWKNVQDVDYVGLAHYRRFFETKITPENIDDLLGENNDIMLCTRLYTRKTIGVRLSYFTCCEDLAIFNDCIKKVSPDYYEDAQCILNGNVISPYNMFVMRKELFDKFCEWQFAILSEVDGYIKPGGYLRTRRNVGYLAESLLYIFAYHNKLKIRYENIVPNVGEHTKKDRLSFLRDAYSTLAFRMLREDYMATVSYGRHALRIEGISVLNDSCLKQ